MSEGGSVYIRSHQGLYLEDRKGTPGLHKDRKGWQQWRICRAGARSPPTSSSSSFFVNVRVFFLSSMLSCYLHEGPYCVFLTSHRGRQLEDRSGYVRLSTDIGSYQRWRILDAGDGQVDSHISKKKSHVHIAAGSARIFDLLTPHVVLGRCSLSRIGVGGSWRCVPPTFLRAPPTACISRRRTGPATVVGCQSFLVLFCCSVCVYIPIASAVPLTAACVSEDRKGWLGVSKDAKGWQKWTIERAES